MPSCQCARHPESCASGITQEDLLCDACRTGTCAMRWRGHALGWQYASHVAWDSDGSMASEADAMMRLQERFPGEGSWITGAGGGKPLHLVDADGRHYLNPDAPLIPHDHNGVPCKYVPS
jgi:hypothetical protein